MTVELVDIAGVPVLVAAPDGHDLDEDVAMDLIAAAIHHHASLVSIPAQRYPDEFFTLSSGLAGAVVQKFANYRQRLAIIGDVSEHLASSGALRAFVTEANRGTQLWFLASQDELESRLTGTR